MSYTVKKEYMIHTLASRIREGQWIVGTYAFCAGFTLGIPLGFYVVWSVCSP